MADLCWLSNKRILSSTFDNKCRSPLVGLKKSHQVICNFIRETAYLKSGSTSRRSTLFASSLSQSSSALPRCRPWNQSSHMTHCVNKQIQRPIPDAPRHTDTACKGDFRNGTFVTLNWKYFLKTLHRLINWTSQIVCFDQSMKSDLSDCLF